MEIIKLYWVGRTHQTVKVFASFLQGMVSRLIVGDFRYGLPKKQSKYWTRLKIEVKAYGSTGNQEHLYNIANYCALEYVAPEHQRSHCDRSTHVPSVTRDKLGIGIDGIPTKGKK